MCNPTNIVYRHCECDIILIYSDIKTNKHLGYEPADVTMHSTPPPKKKRYALDGAFIFFA